MSSGFKVGLNILLAATIVAALAGGVALLFTGRGGSDAIEITLPDRTGVPSQPAIASPAMTPAAMKVYISGEVSRPGVYVLPEGSRAEDAVAAAGGPTVEADLVRVNLARRLSDEEQLHIPRKSETTLEVAQPPPTAGQRPAGKLNINTATSEELQSLPGIGSGKAAAIVEYRRKNGPFDRIDDLVQVSGIGEGILGSIRHLVDTR